MTKFKFGDKVIWKRRKAIVIDVVKEWVKISFKNKNLKTKPNARKEHWVDMTIEELKKY